VAAAHRAAATPHSPAPGPAPPMNGESYERRGWTLVAGQPLKWADLDTIEVRYRIPVSAPIRPSHETFT